MNIKKSFAVVLLLGMSTLSQAVDPFFNSDLQFAGVQPQSDPLNNNLTLDHPIGSCYGGGIVFYVSPINSSDSDQHGLIAALEDDTANCTGANNTCYWDKNAVVTTVITSTPFFTGLDNTTSIVKLGNIGTEAANAANSHVTEDDNCRTCTNWYLPAQNELTILSAQASANQLSFWGNCNGNPLMANGNVYWSSSQLMGTPSGAWSLLSVGVGYVGINPTATALRVRAIRAF